jgi:hypothetical protein
MPALVEVLRLLSKPVMSGLPSDHELHEDLPERAQPGACKVVLFGHTP